MDISHLQANETRRLSCREGDLFAWLRLPSIVASPADWKMLDVWYMRGGDFVTLTSRSIDMPSWVRLHPTEMGGALGRRWGAEYRAVGHDAMDIPDGPMDAPNLWRLTTGDCVAWAATQPHGKAPVPGVFCARACTLAILETTASDISLERLSGGLPEHPLPTAVTDAMHLAVDAVRLQGVPRVWSDRWSIEH